MLVLDTLRLEEAERALCAEAVRCGDLHRAAELLGLGRKSLRRRMARYGLVLPQKGTQAMMTDATVAFAIAFLREIAHIALDIAAFPRHRLAYAKVASWVSFVHPTVPGCEDIARGLVASVHAQGLTAFDVQRLADVLERRCGQALEYVDAVRWSVIEAEETVIRGQLRGLRRNMGWEQIHSRLKHVDPRLARRFRLRHCFLRDARAEAGCERDARSKTIRPVREEAA